LEADVDVLITGASGFVGRALLRALERQGDLRVLGLGRADVDLADGVQVRKVLEAARPHKIVHLAAALPAGGEARAARDRQWRDTFLAGRNVIEGAREVGVAHLLAAGSVDELGDQGGVLGPDLPTRPRSTYGLCKTLVADVAAFAARPGDLRIDWFRPFTVYGPGQTGAMLVPTAFAAAVEGRPAAFTDGAQHRDFLFVDDLVAWVMGGLAWSPPGGGPGELVVHHLGSGRPTPVHRVLAHIAGLFPEAQFRLGALSRRPGEPDCQVALPSPAPWPWTPRTTLEDGLAATAAWWRHLPA
jgi:nucleoside-diphosphate-sugar epimerase